MESRKLQITVISTGKNVTFEQINHRHIFFESFKNSKFNSYSPFGKTSQAIVSVTAVKIQFNSPLIVLRSENEPGVLKKNKNTISILPSNVSHMSKIYSCQFSNWNLRFDVL